MARRRPMDAPRAPLAPLRGALYESHYLTAIAPGGGRAVWLRYTALKERGHAARGSLWCTVFQAGSRPIARRTGSPRVLSPPPPGAWAQIDGATLEPGRAQGALQECSWTIAWDEEAGALPYLPAPWLYDRPLPRSGGVALVPSATFSGHLDVADERLGLAGWRGMVGHNWGSDHAERWIWLHATGLGERDPDGWIDLILARTRVGPLLSPWLPAGAVQLDGRLHPVTAGAGRGLRAEATQERVSVALPKMRHGGLRLAVTSPPTSTARWDYASPRGRPRDVRHCSVSSALVQLGDAPASELFQSFSVEIGT